MTPSSSTEDQAFVGSPQEAALTSANEAIDLWVETAKEFGDPVPEPKGRRLIFA